MLCLRRSAEDSFDEGGSENVDHGTDISAGDLPLDLALMIAVDAVLDALAGEGAAFVIEFIELSIEAALQQLGEGGLRGERDRFEGYGGRLSYFPAG
jgi:hypothetical protein